MIRLAMGLLAMVLLVHPLVSQQVIVLLDDSESMSEFADSSHTRWQVALQAMQSGVGRLPANALVGAITAGGACGAGPRVRVSPSTDRGTTVSSLAALGPYGSTNLNAALLETPSMFDSFGPAERRVVILSDGLNNCAPMRPTCEIAREIHDRYGIRVDVTALVNTPEVRATMDCITRASGGVFTSLAGPISIPSRPQFPWVAIVLGLLTLFAAAVTQYKDLNHVGRVNTRLSGPVATTTLVAGVLALYLLYLGNSPGWAVFVAACVGLSYVAGVVVARVSPAGGGRGQTPGRPVEIISVALLLLTSPGRASAERVELDPPAPAPVAQAAATGRDSSCAPVARPAAQPLHHIIAIDGSGSIREAIEPMKALTACYAKMYVRPDDELTLIFFSIDSAASVRVVPAFVVPSEGAVPTLAKLLAQVPLQERRRTLTRFQPLAQTLSQVLHTVRYAPVVLVASDGRSDTPENDVPFEAFSSGDMYQAPFMRGWRVAVQGSAALDLTALFTRPFPPQLPAEASVSRPPIEPCLVDPPLNIDGPDTVRLTPTFNPLRRRYSGKLDLQVSNDCVERYRAFTVLLDEGGRTTQLASFTRELIGTTAERHSVPIHLSQAPAGGRLQLRVRLQEGQTIRPVELRKPRVVVADVESYFSAWGLTWVLIVVPTAIFAVLVVLRAKSVADRQASRPLILTSSGGGAVSVLPGNNVRIGGEGSDLRVPGYLDDQVLVDGTPTADNARLRLTPRDGVVLISGGGAESTGSIDYQLGARLNLRDQEGREYAVTIRLGTSEDLGAGFGTPAPAGVGYAEDSLII